MLIFIILAFIASIGIAAFQYIYNNKEKSQLNYWLFSLRFLSIFAILILFINPSFKKNQIETVKPRLLIAVDNSSSIKHNSLVTNVLALIDKLKNNKELNSKFDLHFFKFGSRLASLDSLTFSENRTNLELPFKEFSKLYKDGINPVVLITDGNQTLGNNVAFENYKNPVYPVVFGDTTKVDDIYISQLNVNKFTYINNNLPVEIFVNYTGNSSVIKTLKVLHKGKTIFTKQLQFSGSKNVQIESFFITSSESGNQYYTATIESLENEKSTVNNSKTFSVNVIEDQSKILILSAINHPDLGMLKKSIETNKQRSVSIFNIENKNFNINDYQLIILYQPNNKFKYIFDEISSKKINNFIITGVSTDWNFLNANQKIFYKNASKQTENYSATLNKEYAVFQNSDINFNSFAPLEEAFGEVKFKYDFNTLLFQKIGNIELKKPLLATFEIDTQKGAVLFGENSWRWRMNSFAEYRNFELFDGFISNLIQYLTSTKTNSRLNVSVEPIYFANETIFISASYLDKNLNFDGRAKLWFSLLNSENKILQKIPFSLGNNSFNVSLSDIKPGDYRYIINVENQKETFSGTFKVLPFDVEQQFSNATSDNLKQLAINTKGTVFYNNQENKLVQQLIDDPQYKSIQKSSIEKTPLIDWKWILAFIVALLTIEWFTRKYFGKI